MKTAIKDIEIEKQALQISREESKTFYTRIVALVVGTFVTSICASTIL